MVCAVVTVAVVVGGLLRDSSSSRGSRGRRSVPWLQ
jgi:hypothetical protein